MTNICGGYLEIQDKYLSMININKKKKHETHICYLNMKQLLCNKKKTRKIGGKYLSLINIKNKYETNLSLLNIKKST